MVRRDDLATAAAAGLRGAALLKIGVVALVIFLIAAVALSGVMMAAVRPDIIGNNAASGCQVPGQPQDPGPRPNASIRAQQIANARIIDQVAAKLGLPGQASRVAIIAATGESDLINVDYGDDRNGVTNPDGSPTTSLGLFQQQTSQGWGTREQVMNPAYAATSFFTGAGHDNKGGLVAVPSWETLEPTDAIHRVQRNADPNHYTRFYARADAVITEAGIDLARPGTAGAGAVIIDPNACAGAGADDRMPPIGTGACPLDSTAADLRSNPASCQQAIDYMVAKMERGDRDAYRRCLAIVALAYGWNFSNFATAYEAGKDLQDRGLLSTDTTNIPRGAVMWWDGSGVGSSAGHVAIYDGTGHILSNDVPVADGRIGRVAFDYPQTVWGHKFMGWSPPYFPKAG